MLILIANLPGNIRATALLNECTQLLTNYLKTISSKHNNLLLGANYCSTLTTSDDVNYVGYKMFHLPGAVKFNRTEFKIILMSYTLL